MEPEAQVHNEDAITPTIDDAAPEDDYLYLEDDSILFTEGFSYARSSFNLVTEACRSVHKLLKLTEHSAVLFSLWEVLQVEFVPNDTTVTLQELEDMHVTFAPPSPAAPITIQIRPGGRLVPAGASTILRT